MPDTILIILVLLTFFCLISFIYGVVHENEGFGLTGLIGLLMTGIMGWGCVGTCYTVETKVYEMQQSQIEVLKASNSIVVLAQGFSNPIVYTSHEDYSTIDSCTVFYCTVEYNMYGGKIEKSLIHNKPELTLKEHKINE